MIEVDARAEREQRLVGADVARGALAADVLLAGAVSIGLYHVLWVYSVRMNGPAVAVVLLRDGAALATKALWGK